MSPSVTNEKRPGAIQYVSRNDRYKAKQKAKEVNMTATAVEPLWYIEHVAEYLGVPVATIYDWRTHGKPCPPSRKVGKHLRFDPTEVRAWFLGLDAA